MKQSAGILAYRTGANEIEFFLVHPGGPYFAKKNAGWWTIPKGEPNEDETAAIAASREFEEETGLRISGQLIDLGSITQKAGKKVQAFAVAMDFDEKCIHSNTFNIEWPPRSGQYQSFPEIDRAAWYGLKEAKLMINAQQAEFLDRLLILLG